MTNKAGVAIFILDKSEFPKKSIPKDKEGYYIMIQGLIQEEDIAVINIHTPKIEAPKYIKQLLTDIKEEINNNTKTVGNFNTQLTSIDRSSRQKITTATEVVK